MARVTEAIARDLDGSESMIYVQLFDDGTVPPSASKVDSSTFESFLSTVPIRYDFTGKKDEKGRPIYFRRYATI